MAESSDGNDTIHKQISAIALQASNAFASGNVIGGTGIIGCLMILASAIALGIGVPWKDTPTPNIYVGSLLGLVGTVLIFASGSLYRLKVRIRSETMMLLARGYIDISLRLADKVNPGTVAATNMTEYADKFLEGISRLLGEGTSGEKPSGGQPAIPKSTG
ncbi:MAG: hypothetical protein DMF75_02635 [Acidobacteria bacterium]|nr:MAG: hypothetical protein DMF75_02635 [Acidobacteriota bacterium]